MSNVLPNLRYTEQHEWVKVEGDIALVGITDFAQNALGDVTFVELPAVDQQVQKGDDIVVVESKHFVSWSALRRRITNPDRLDIERCMLGIDVEEIMIR